VDQFIKFHFSINQNNKIYEINVDPGCSWEDIESVLEKFKTQFLSLKEATIKAEEERKAKEAQSSTAQ
jgi:hypothetical protein